MLLLLSALVSANEITVQPSTDGAQATGREGEHLNPGAFARQVGDYETARQFYGRRRRAIIGTSVVGAAGAFALVPGVAFTSISLFAISVGGSDALLLPGVGLMALGAGALAGGGAFLAMRLGHLYDLESWYTLEQAQALADQADANPLSLGPFVVDGGRGLEIYWDGAPMNTQDFAKLVGDGRTHRRCMGARALLFTGSIVVFSSAIIPVAAATSDQLEPQQRMLFGAYVGGAIAGGSALMFARWALDQPRAWYTEAEAQSWIDDAAAGASGPPSRSGLELAVSPAVVPAPGRVTGGLAVSGRW